MRDFKRLSKILWMKHRIWIVLFLALVLLLSIFESYTALKMEGERYIGYIQRVEWIYNNKDKEFKSPMEYEDAKYAAEGRFYAGEEYFKLEKELTKERIQEANDKWKELAKEYGYKRGERQVDEVHKASAYSVRDTIYRDIYLIDTKYHPFFVGYYFGSFSMFLVTLLFGFLLTSLENLTAYYEFANTFPWSRGKNYLMKFSFGLIILAGVYIVTTIIGHAIWSTSMAAALSDTGGILRGYFFRFLQIFAFYCFVFGVGELAGNFIGHIGLLIIAMTSTKLIQFIIGQILHIVGRGDIEAAMGNFIEKVTSIWPIGILHFPGDYFSQPYPRVLLILTLMGLFLVGLGYWSSEHSAKERTGYVVKNKNFSKVVMILALLTTAVIVTAIITGTFYVETKGLTVLIFILSTLISYFFYRFLFKVKIGV